MINMFTFDVTRRKLVNLETGTQIFVRNNTKADMWQLIVLGVGLGPLDHSECVPVLFESSNKEVAQQDFDRLVASLRKQNMILEYGR